MNLACSPVIVGRLLAVAGMLLTLILVGCDTTGSYPADMTYPLRTDPIVVKTPTAKKDYPYPPGQLQKAIDEVQKEGGTLIGLDLYLRELRERQGKTADPQERKKSQQQLQEVSRRIPRGLRDALDASFGTPSRPRVQVDPSLPQVRQINAQLDKLKLDRRSLDEGSKLYRRNCLHCHGVTGDGRGPTGPWVSPHPRDYRAGKFKFTSTGKEARPSRSDLLRTLYYGLDGSSMPSFSLLPEKDLENLVSYVIHLSLRGEVEIFLNEQVVSEEIQSEADIPGKAMDKLIELIGKWTESNDTQLKPDAEWMPAPDDREAREKDIIAGFKLFFNKDLNCAGCHVDFGRASQFQFDNWGTLVRPNNLTGGAYRGGRRPIDFFWRIRSGIIVMTAFPKDFEYKVEGKAEKEKLDDRKVGQLVSFIQALPYPQMLPADLREQVYGIRPEPKKEKLAAAH